MIAEAEDLVADCSGRVRDVVRMIYGVFVEEAGCTAYVKTIYIGFELDGKMVAATYPHAASVEVALALPDDVEGEGLVDATHLTWRTMPVAVELRSREDVERVRPYLDSAVARVRGGTHDVELPQERFIGRARWIASRNVLGKPGGI